MPLTLLLTRVAHAQPTLPRPTLPDWTPTDPTVRRQITDLLHARKGGTWEVETFAPPTDNSPIVARVRQLGPWNSFRRGTRGVVYLRRAEGREPLEMNTFRTLDGRTRGTARAFARSNFVRSLVQFGAFEAGFYALDRMGVDSTAMVRALPFVLLAGDLARDINTRKDPIDLKDPRTLRRLDERAGDFVGMQLGRRLGSSLRWLGSAARRAGRLRPRRR